VGSLPGSDLCSIDIDNREAARMSVEHLIGLGHTRIGCITNASSVFTAAADRLAGYEQALRDHHLPLQKSLVRHGSFNQESGYQAMRSMLAETELPTAVFIASDVVAIGSLRALAEQGIRVPDDMAVFGFDNVVDSRYTSPPLSTVSFPVEEHGRRSAEILFELMSGTISAPYRETTPFEIIVRASTVGNNRAGIVQEEKTSSSNWEDKQSKEVSP
jgi:LacI family transcriptional regulator